MSAPERPRRLRPRPGAHPGPLARWSVPGGPRAASPPTRPRSGATAAAGVAGVAGAARGGVRRALAGLAVALLLLGACGDDGGDRGDGDDRDTGAATDPTGDERSAGPTTTLGPTGPIDPADLLAAAGGAPAARGAELGEPPGDPDRTPLEGFAETAAAVTAPDGTVITWCLLLALVSEQRQRGLMEVTDLGGYAGMLFVWPDDTSSGFYMRNTPMPLSIGWIDAEGTLVSTADMEPCADVDGCPTYSPDGPYRFALEVPDGRLVDLGVVEGSRLAVGGECAPRSPS